MNFTAIDFETATGYRNSACAVGIVTVRDSKIIDTFYKLVQPPDNYYWGRMIDVHGITSDDTQNLPTFEELYPEIKQLLKGETLVAHSASFDRSVLIDTMKYYNLDPDTLNLKPWVCTLDIYRKKGFRPADLGSCCAKMNIDLNHHQALSDAIGCAKLYLGSKQELG